MSHLFTEVEFLQIERIEELRRKAEADAKAKAELEIMQKKVDAIKSDVDDAIDLELEIEALEKLHLELKKDELAAKKRKIEAAIEDIGFGGVKTVESKKGIATRVTGTTSTVDVKALCKELKIPDATVQKHTTTKSKKPYVKLTPRIANPYLTK